MAMPISSQLALALAVVKTKPADQVMDEYLDQLSGIVRKDATSFSLALVDPAAYWRQECLRLRQCMDAAYADCGRELARKEGLGASAADAISTMSSKRKRNEDSRSRSSRAKCPRPTGSTQDNDGIVNPGTEAELALCPETMALSAEVATVIYRLHSLQHGPAEDGQKSARQMLHLLISLLKALPSLLTAIAPPGVSAISISITDTIREGTAPATALLIMRTISVALQSYDYLDVHDHGQCISSGALYHMVKVFQVTIRTLMGICAPSPTTQINVGNESVIATGLARSRHLSIVGDLLRGMFKMLDPNKRHHTPLFEGYLCCILDELGPLLSQLTDDRNAAETASLHSAGPVLLEILETALRLAPKSFRRPTTTTKSGTPTTSLTDVVYDKLQRTLIRATIPTIQVMDSAADFIRPLPEPSFENDGGGNAASKRKGQKSAKGKKKASAEVDSLEEFKAGLWGVLGWDILTREGPLMEALAVMDHP